MSLNGFDSAFIFVTVSGGGTVLLVLMLLLLFVCLFGCLSVRFRCIRKAGIEL